MKKIIVLSAAGLIFLAIILFFAFNAVVFVNVTNKSGGTLTTSAILEKELKPVGGSGMLIVPRGAHGLAVSNGNGGMVQTNLDLPWIGIASVSVQIDDTKKANAVDYLGAEPICATYSSATDKLLHYDCEQLTTLLSSDTSADGKITNKKVADLTYIKGQTLPSYNGGVLGIAEGTNAGDSHNSKQVLIKATTANGVSAYEAPSQIDKDYLSGLRIFTDTNNTENNRFILVDTFGVIYLGTPSGDGKSATYKRISAPEDYSFKYNQTLCVVRDETADCFRGRNNIVPEKDAVIAKPSLVKLSFSDGVIFSKNVEGVTVLDGLYATDSALYGKNDKTLYALEPAPKTYKAHQLAQSAELVAVGQKLYFMNSNGVHEMDDKTYDSHQLYSSPDVVVRGIYSSAGKLFVFGKTKTTGDTIYAYQIR